MNRAEEVHILHALESLVDPEIGINVVDLGLIESITFPGPQTVEVTMLVTSPGCPLRETLVQGAARVLMALPEINHATVRVVDQPTWTPHRIRPGLLAN